MELIDEVPGRRADDPRERLFDRCAIGIVELRDSFREIRQRLAAAASGTSSSVSLMATTVPPSGA